MGFDAWFKRCFPGIILVLVAVSASLQAAGMSQLVGVTLGPTSAPPSRPIAPAPAAPAGREPRPSAQAILARNPFDSTYAQQGEAVAVVADEQVEPGPEWYRDPSCQDARVVIIVSSDDPSWSFAGLVGPDGATKLRRRGDAFGTSRVAYVGERKDERKDERKEGRDADAHPANRVWLIAPNGGRCQLALGAPIPDRKARPASKEPAPAAYSSKIHKTGDHAFDVDRTVLQELMANPTSLMKVRVVPGPDGIKLAGLPADSALAAVGLENGDKLTSINGFEMNDPKVMLDAYTKLATADHVTANIVRGGKPIVLDLALK